MMPVGQARASTPLWAMMAVEIADQPADANHSPLLVYPTRDAGAHRELVADLVEELAIEPVEIEADSQRAAHLLQHDEKRKAGKQQHLELGHQVINRVRLIVDWIRQDGIQRLWVDANRQAQERE